MPILSDPTDEDTDDDKIPDGYDSDMKMPDDWYAFSDPNPLKSDINETVLEHDFFSVDYEFKEGAQEKTGAWQIIIIMHHMEDIKVGLEPMEYMRIKRFLAQDFRLVISQDTTFVVKVVV